MTHDAGAPTRRFAAAVEYDGTAFSGWQRLSAPGTAETGPKPTLQATVEAALESIAGHPVATTCAGRTDAGVHASAQVVHFDSHAARDGRAWSLGGSTRLPPEVCIRWCREVPREFNARFSARARRYVYRILNRPVRPALGRQLLAWERVPLDAAAMHEAAQSLLGERDFSSFRTVHCQATHARRELQHVEVRRVGEVVEVEVQANAFLHHMVRNIVGSLLMVGRAERDRAWLAGVLEARDRTLAGPTAPAGGLVFLGPRYPRHWNLPEEVCL